MSDRQVNETTSHWTSWENAITFKPDLYVFLNLFNLIFVIKIIVIPEEDIEAVKYNSLGIAGCHYILLKFSCLIFCMRNEMESTVSYIDVRNEMESTVSYIDIRKWMIKIKFWKNSILQFYYLVQKSKNI